MDYKGSVSIPGASELVEDWAVYSNGTIMKKGAVVMRGTTLGTNLNFAILGTGALADVIGVLYEEQAAVTAGDDSNAAGTNFTKRKVIVDPFSFYRAEFDQADTMAVASVTSTTQFTVTSGETNMQGGWLYCVAGTGIGELHLITTDDGSGLYTIKEAGTIAATDTLIKIVPKWHQLIKTSSDATMIGTDAAAGSGKVTVKDIWIKSDSIPLARLDPTKHSGLTGLNSDNVKFYADVIFRDHVYNTLD